MMWNLGRTAAVTLGPLAPLLTELKVSIVLSKGDYTAQTNCSKQQSDSKLVATLLISCLLYFIIKLWPCFMNCPQNNPIYWGVCTCGALKKVPIH